MEITTAFEPAGHLIGYARISTTDQSLDLQTDALREAGCDKVFTDQASGAKADRPGLEDALAYLREGDTLVVWRLDRFGRSLKDLIHRIDELTQKGVHFRSLKEGIDTTSSTGRLVLHIFGALAEFERELIHERTIAGLASARARGKKGGRPRKMTRRKLELASRMMKDPETSIDQVTDAVGVSKATLYRYVSPEGAIRQEV